MNIDYDAVTEILKNFLNNENTEILGISVGEERQVREAMKNLLTAYEKEKEKNKKDEWNKQFKCKYMQHPTSFLTEENLNKLEQHCKKTIQYGNGRVLEEHQITLELIMRYRELQQELEKEKEKNKQAYRKANNYLYFNDSADYEVALWEVIRTLRPDLAEKWDNGECAELKYIEEE